MRNWREEIRRDIHERMTTSNMYLQDPETAEQEVTLDTIADITKDAQEDGRDTTGIFDDFGNSMFVDPPSMSADQYNTWTASYGSKYQYKRGYTARDIVPTSVNETESDSSKSPGPLCWYYNSSEDRTYIGFLRQSDRGFNQVARFDGDWDDWNESDHSGTNYFGGNNYLVSSFDAEDVSWLKTERSAGRTSDFRAFVDDNDMTDTDSHGRINVNMINSVKGDYTNYWSVFNADEPVLSDTKITLKFHFRTNSYWRYFGNNAVDSNPSSINTGSDKAQRAKTPPPLPLFYNSDDETPTFYDSFNGRQVAAYGMSGWDFLGDLVDTVEFTVPQGGQLNANGNKIAGKFNVNGIGLKWRYIKAAENPDQNPAHDEPDNDQNGYNHTRNFPTNDDGDPIPFDDYLIWTISINGQDYQLRNGIEGLTCAIGIPGYTKEKWVQGPVNSRKGLPGFTNSYDNQKAKGNVNDMNLEGINQIMNLSKTIQQLKKKKGQQFIQRQKERALQVTLKQPSAPEVKTDSNNSFSTNKGPTAVPNRVNERITARFTTLNDIDSLSIARRLTSKQPERAYKGTDGKVYQNPYRLTPEQVKEVKEFIKVQKEDVAKLENNIQSGFSEYDSKFNEAEKLTKGINLPKPSYNSFELGGRKGTYETYLKSAKKSATASLKRIESSKPQWPGRRDGGPYGKPSWKEIGNAQYPKATAREMYEFFMKRHETYQELHKLRLENAEIRASYIMSRRFLRTSLRLDAPVSEYESQIANLKDFITQSVRYEKFRIKEAAIFHSGNGIQWGPKSQNNWKGANSYVDRSRKGGRERISKLTSRLEKLVKAYEARKDPSFDADKVNQGTSGKFFRESSLEKWEKKLIKEDIDLPKKNFFELDRSDIWRKQDKTKNMIASREKGMRVDQRMAYSRFFTADSQNKADRTIESVKKEFNYQGKPAANGFPDQPPKEIGKDGFTKDYGQRDGYYNKLDPISANTMQHVGNHDPNMQKKVDSARQDSRLKQRDRILSNFKNVVNGG